MRVFLLAGSIRKGSYNLRLIRAAAAVAREAGAECEVAGLADYPIPHFNQDEEDEAGLPETARRLAEAVGAADRVILACPEYNGFPPGVFKNALDWLSRPDPGPLEGKPVLLAAASPGRRGGVRALGHLKALMESLDAKVFPESFSLGGAEDAFADDRLKDGGRQSELSVLVKSFLSAASS